MFHSFLSFFLSPSMRFSLISFAVMAVLGLVSMGALGMGLFYFSYPLLKLVFRVPSIDALRGDWVWPAMIIIGMAWSLGFIFAGTLQHLCLQQFNWSSFVYKGIYLFVLWLWASIMWLATLAANVSSIDYSYTPPKYPDKLIASMPSWNGCSILMEFEKGRYRIGDVISVKMSLVNPGLKPVTYSMFNFPRVIEDGSFLITDQRDGQIKYRAAGADYSSAHILSPSDSKMEEEIVFPPKSTTLLFDWSLTDHGVIGVAKKDHIKKRYLFLEKRETPFWSVFKKGTYRIQWWNGESMDKGETLLYSNIASFTLE